MVMEEKKYLEQYEGKGSVLTSSLWIEQASHHNDSGIGQLAEDTLRFHLICKIPIGAVRDTILPLLNNFPLGCNLTINALKQS